jgi:hypothetical protein
VAQSRQYLLERSYYSQDGVDKVIAEVQTTVRTFYITSTTGFTDDEIQILEEEFLVKANQDDKSLGRLNYRLTAFGNGKATSDKNFKKTLNAAERMARRTGETFETI